MPWVKEAVDSGTTHKNERSAAPTAAPAASADGSCGHPSNIMPQPGATREQGGPSRSALSRMKRRRAEKDAWQTEMKQMRTEGREFLRSVGKEETAMEIASKRLREMNLESGDHMALAHWLAKPEHENLVTFFVDMSPDCSKDYVHCILPQAKKLFADFVKS